MIYIDTICCLILPCKIVLKIVDLKIPDLVAVLSDVVAYNNQKTPA